MQQLSVSDFSFLIVDPNAYMRVISRNLLSGLGIRRILEAENGSQGVEFFEAYSPDILITEIKMPEKNGIELIRYVRENGREDKPNMAMILTSQPSKNYVQHAIEAGVDEFLCKPISASLLSKRLRHLINHKYKEEEAC